MEIAALSDGSACNERITFGLIKRSDRFYDVLEFGVAELFVHRKAEHAFEEFLGLRVVAAEAMLVDRLLWNQIGVMHFGFNSSGSKVFGK